MPPFQSDADRIQQLEQHADKMHDRIAWLGSEASNWRERAMGAEALLREARDFIDHTEPYQPDAPCCVLEARIDEFLDARMARDRS